MHVLVQRAIIRCSAYRWLPIACETSRVVVTQVLFIITCHIGNGKLVGNHNTFQIYQTMSRRKPDNMSVMHALVRQAICQSQTGNGKLELEPQQYALDLAGNVGAEVRLGYTISWECGPARDSSPRVPESSRGSKVKGVSLFVPLLFQLLLKQLIRRVSETRQESRVQNVILQRPVRKQAIVAAHKESPTLGLFTQGCTLYEKPEVDIMMSYNYSMSCRGFH